MRIQHMKLCTVQLNLCSEGNLYPQLHILEKKKDVKINHLNLLKHLEKEEVVKSQESRMKEIIR